MFSSLSREINPFVLSAAVLHTCHTDWQPWRVQQALRAGSACLPSTLMAPGSSHPSQPHRDSPKLCSLQGSSSQPAGFYFCLPAPACYCSLLVLSALLPQRTRQHTSEAKDTLGNLSVLWCFSLRSEQKDVEQREDSPGKESGTEFLCGRESTASNDLVFSKTHGLIPGFLNI